LVNTNFQITRKYYTNAGTVDDTANSIIFFICDGQWKAAANRFGMHHKYVRRHNEPPLFILHLHDPHTAPKHAYSEKTSERQHRRTLYFVSA
jgi:hypothetical protein